MNKFYICSAYESDEELNLPIRKTANSAGYDFEVAEDTVIPSYNSCFSSLRNAEPVGRSVMTLDEVKALTKSTGAKPTLVPTGIKCELDPDCYLELSVRSSSPLKSWIVLANGVGIIDADYFNNEDNEGHIYFQVINLSPFDILLEKGEAIGQGIIKHYEKVEGDCPLQELRKGGFGSTDEEK